MWLRWRNSSFARTKALASLRAVSSASRAASNSARSRASSPSLLASLLLVLPSLDGAATGKEARAVDVTVAAGDVEVDGDDDDDDDDDDAGLVCRGED